MDNAYLEIKCIIKTYLLLYKKCEFFGKLKKVIFVSITLNLAFCNVKIIHCLFMLFRYTLLSFIGIITIKPLIHLTTLHGIIVINNSKYNIYR